MKEIDIKILKEFCKLKDNEYTSTWAIMKKILPAGKNSENQAVKRRIKSMAKDGLFIVEGKNPEVYTLISDKVMIKQFNFPDKRTNGLAIKTNDKWEIFQLN